MSADKPNPVLASEYNDFPPVTKFSEELIDFAASLKPKIECHDGDCKGSVTYETDLVEGGDARLTVGATGSIEDGALGGGVNVRLTKPF